MSRFCLIAVLVLSFFGAGAVLAAEEKNEAATAVNQAAKAEINPEVEKVNEKARALAASLTEQEIEYLAHIRQAFGIIRSTQVVQEDVGNAVRVCGKNNPDMKMDMTDRHKEWSEKIKVVLDDKESDMNALITKDVFKKPGDIKAYLNLVDKAAKGIESRMDKTPVTTPEACGKLLTSMNETEEVLIELLEKIQLPGMPEAPSAAVESEGATP